MGCGESKPVVESVSSSDAKKKLQGTLEDLEVVRVSSASSVSSGVISNSSAGDAPNTPDNVLDEMVERAPSGNSLLERIPISDLGESLDARRHHPWPAAADEHVVKTHASALSHDSSDSGIYDLDEDYSFVITENSSADLVKKVQEEFVAAEDLDLTLYGKACPRLLSGQQKARVEEQAILQSLRDEGLIQTHKQKAGGGLSFDIMEESPLSYSAGNEFKPKDFIPSSHKRYLESQRNRHHLRNLTSADVERRQFLADERRRAEMELKREKMLILAKPIDSDSQQENLKKKRDAKIEAAVDHREEHLRDLRDKLKAKNKYVQEVKLKKIINGVPVPVPIAVGGGPTRKNYTDGFFD